jgi:hypothetical protein
VNGVQDCRHCHRLVLTERCPRWDKSGKARVAHVRKAMQKADFNSVRGKFRFGNNHSPMK